MKKSISYMMAACLGISLLLSGCAGSGQAPQKPAAESSSESGSPAKTSSALQEKTTVSQDSADSGKASDSAGVDGIRVGSLKGPTSMGLASLIDKASKGETENSYEFTMSGTADELVGKIANADLDIALLPANIASVLYAKTQGQVTAIDINTLGVLYVVASDDSIQTMNDLKGRTIYMTGKGTTPEYVMNYLLSQNGLSISNVDLQFKSEAAEVASILKEDSTAIGVLPQPFAAAACIQNEALKTVLDLTEQWNLLNQESKSMLVTGVTVIRSDFLRENKAAAELFLKDHQASAAFAAEHVEEAAELIAAQGIVEKAPIAKKALPLCNIVCLTGEEMKAALSGYLSVLYEQDAKSIGGAMPGDDFYYIP